eukprot:1225579-Amorphochlora_amoeboformis.AAC.1
MEFEAEGVRLEMEIEMGGFRLEMEFEMGAFRLEIEMGRFRLLSPSTCSIASVVEPFSSNPLTSLSWERQRGREGEGGEREGERGRERERERGRREGEKERGRED